MKEGQYEYTDSFGSGISLQVKGEQYALRKNVEISSLESLGDIPRDAEYLQIAFHVDTDFDVPLGRHTGKYVLGEYSTILTPEAWDSFNPKKGIQEDDDHKGLNQVDIEWEFKKDEQGYTFVKYIPVEWLKKAQYPVYADVDISYGSESEFDTGTVAAVRLLKLDNNAFSVCWTDNTDASSEGKCRAGTVSGSTISWGSTSQFSSDVSGPDTNFTACDADTNKIAVVYANDPNSDEGEIRFATVSGTTIGTWGTALDINGTTNDAEEIDCTKIATDKVAISFNDETTSDTGMSVVCTASGTTASCGSIDDWAATDYWPHYTKVEQLGTDKFVTCADGSDTSTVICLVSTVLGTTLTHGPVKTVYNNDGSYIGVASPAADSFVVSWLNEVNTQGEVAAGTAAGTTTITMGSSYVFDTSEAFDSRIAEHDSTHFLLTWADDPGAVGTPTGKSNYASVNFSTRAITLGSEEVFRSPSIDFNTDNGLDVVRIGSDKFVTCYSDTSDSLDGKCIIGDYQSAGSNTAPTEPTSLQTEDQTNPTNITDSSPEFDAIFQDQNATNTATHYQIQVSTSSAFASIKWDSSQTALASSTPVGMRIADISYGGSALASSTTHYWRIKFWDNGGLAGAWSTSTSTFTLAAAAGDGNNPPTAPTALLAEGQTNPGNISDPSPEFSAIFNDPNSTSTATHYRIQVATTSVFTSTYWDTGTTTLASSTPPNMRIADISYGGSALASSTAYYWRIKFSDNSGAEGAWSTTTSTFSLASSTGTSSPPLGFMLQNINYTYDVVGNITQITDNSDTGAGKVVIFGYDNLYRLTSASTSAASSTPYRYQYAYDALGNITGSKLNASATTTYSYAGTNYANPHAPTSIGGTTHTYDNAGNLLTDGTWTHAWDYRNRLSSSGGSATSTYAYDHTTARVSLTENGTTTVYANKYFDTDGTTNSLSIFDPQGTLLGTVAGTSTSYIHLDHLGSTNVTTDGIGNLKQTLDYYPYGNERIAVGDNSSDRHYIGELYDESTNLNYLNARYYNSTKGNFISQDPVFIGLGVDKRTAQLLLDPQQMNSYGYARGNPVNHTDKSGECVELFSAGFCLAVWYSVTAYSAAQIGVTGFDLYQTNYGPYNGGFTPEQKAESWGSAGLTALTTAAGAFAPVVGLARYANVLEALSIGLDMLEGYFGGPGKRKVDTNSNITIGINGSSVSVAQPATVNQNSGGSSGSGPKSPTNSTSSGGSGAAYSSASASLSAASAAINRGDYAAASKYISSASSALNKVN